MNDIKLTSENVERIFIDCLFQEKEAQDNPIIVEGIVSNYGFHPGRINKYKSEIYNLLKQLPKEFQKNGGGGMSFLNACNDKNGNQWTGLHNIMEQLFCLGIGIGKVKYCLSRQLWNCFPGNMPYVVID